MFLFIRNNNNYNIKFKIIQSADILNQKKLQDLYLATLIFIGSFLKSHLF